MYYQDKCKMSWKEGFFIPFNFDLKLSYDEVQNKLQATLIVLINKSIIGLYVCDNGRVKFT